MDRRGIVHDGTMKNPLWRFSATLMACLLTSGAQAQSLYGSLSGMYVAPEDSTLSATGEDLSLDLNTDLKGGLGGALAFGYGAPVGLRGEVEVSYRANDLDSLLGVKLDGEQSALSLMLNGLYVFDSNEKVKPYFGAGLGLSKRKAVLSAQTIDGEAIPGASEDDTVLAYQGMVGVIYPSSETMEVRFGYRYFGTGDVEFKEEEGSVSFDYATHNIEAGVMFRF